MEKEDLTYDENDNSYPNQSHSKPALQTWEKQTSLSSSKIITNHSITWTEYGCYMETDKNKDYIGTKKRPRK